MIKNLFKSFSSQALDFLETVVLAFIIFLLVDTFIAQPHIVRGSSMLNNFHNQERIFTESVSYRFKEPGRGDIVVFRYPLAPSTEYIKRVIGLPGEKILLENGQVTILNKEHPSGFILKENYLKLQTKTLGKKEIREGVLYEVPADRYAVLGDNRQESADSREWGTVPKRNIIGRVVLRYWPPTALGLFGGTNY